ncbi:hypothetical protein CPB84DRAFT_1845085 [Gymnopilus junonius]|uniref:Uncharacterized protein n=1 Tax=Gymnopilus junonius TaxID=109634 RepID=A0A9P5TQH9_GYMJU|nr:hypothetical protein CPB84DRAFT_1845085 [Gymnopilus junonius]
MPPITVPKQPTLYPYGKTDCYRIARTANGRAVFATHLEPNQPLHGTDALIIAEISGLPSRPPALKVDPVRTTLETGVPWPRSFYIMSANTNWIPNLDRMAPAYMFMKMDATAPTI